jgi:ketosteroid isomerase-like protein
MPMTPSVSRLITSGSAAVLALVVSAPVAAQDATPAGGAMTFPITPDPAACQVEPRSTDELLALWYTPEGSPVPAATPTWGAQTTSLTLPVGAPADEATASEVISAVSEVFSCFAAGDFARATALFSDDLVRSFGGEPGTTVEDARAFLEATPAAGMEGTGEERVIAITDVMDLGDGRIGAFVVDESGGQLDTVYAIFERQQDRWLVDEIIDFAPRPGGEGEGA